jgi:hypothetical protein
MKGEERQEWFFPLAVLLSTFLSDEISFGLWALSVGTEVPCGPLLETSAQAYLLLLGLMTEIIQASLPSDLPTAGKCLSDFVEWLIIAINVFPNGLVNMFFWLKN